MGASHLKRQAKEKFLREREDLGNEFRETPSQPEEEQDLCFIFSLSKLFESLICTFCFYLKEKLLSSREKLKYAAHWELLYSPGDLDTDICHSYLLANQQIECLFHDLLYTKSVYVSHGKILDIIIL